MTDLKLRYGPRSHGFSPGLLCKIANVLSSGGKAVEAGPEALLLGTGGLKVMVRR